MLPDIGTSERNALEAKALEIAIDFLEATNGNIPDALYLTYMSFRSKFAEERDLMDRAPSGDAWREMVVDARQLEHYVSGVWTTAITHACVLGGSKSWPL